MPTDALQLLGRTIADKYAVESVVADGGFATVYRATHLIWKRPVALKVFTRFGDFSPEQRQRVLENFVQEGALLGDLSARSAAIVQARDIGMLESPRGGGEVPYMVLEWLEGATLDEVLTQERAEGLPPRDVAGAIALLGPAAEAIALAHRHGIAHRDVKPGNIFVIGDARGACTIKLLDFGIAKVVLDAQKLAGTFHRTLGDVTSFTPAYGAPEQFSRAHGATGPWSDVFALALIVTELLAGREPLAGDDLAQLAAASADPDRRPTPRAMGVAVSDAVEAVLARAVAVRPTDRWPTAGELWSALRLAAGLEARGPADAAPASSTVPAPVARDTALPESVPLAASSTVPRVEPPRVTSATPRAVPIALVAAVVAGALGLGLARRSGAGSAGSSALPPSGPTTDEGHLPVAPAAPAAPVSATTPCPEGMVRIPGGSFFMGSDDGLPLEKPAHPVDLAPYCIDRFEVTVTDYKACSDVGRCRRAGTTNAWEGLSDADRAAFDPLCNARDPEGKGRHPINCVDWKMAERYCHERGGRLPTEAEWEFAARGPDGRRYPWGDDDPSAERLNACGKECVAWGQKLGVPEKPMYAQSDGFPNTAPVGSFPKGASPYGVEDVVGNVWEWVADWYAPYPASDAGAASDQSERNPTGPEQGEERVIRGGAWNGSYPSWVRPTFRYKDSPEKRSYGIGFRCAG